MSVSLIQPDKRLVARSFGSAASSYDGVAELQRYVGRRLLDYLPPLAGGLCILDVGAGTGVFSQILGETYPSAHIVALDIAEGMLRCAQDRFSGSCVGGDAEALPFAASSVDLIFSNLAIQWCVCPVATFQEFHRVLRPGGHLVFSTFGPMTLQELRYAWARVDVRSHVNEFIESSILCQALSEAGFAALEFQATLQTLEYVDVMSLMRELKGLGARNLTADRPRHLMGKGAMGKMVAAYPATGSIDSTSVFATFEVFAGSAVSLAGTP